MKIHIHSIVVALLLPLSALAQSEPQVIHLWANGAPGFENRKDEPEQAKDWWVRKINNPSITVFRPPAGKANGCAVVVAPGGGFRELVFVPEGKQAAEFLNTLAACRASPSMLLNKRRTPFGWRTNITRKLLNVERGVASYQYARTLCRLGPPDADVSAL
jgi:hypothetical protein